ncbi:MAG: helix-turn-helix domain-containing protein [Oscillospiraceae bacterium]|nr:helix-turn-helix domain-containing protein [Oscillospiraceae bacterium]
MDTSTFINNNQKKTTGVIYQTPDGQNAQGYIIDGKTYKDRNGTTRVDIGSTVPTAGGTFTLTGAGGVKTPSSVTNDLMAAYRQSAGHLDAAHNARSNAINAATEREINRINDQRKNAGNRYEESNRAAYQAYVNASNPYGAAEEQRAKIGLSDSGYAETSKMQLANTYQQALNENALARNAYLQELDKAYRDAKYNGDIQLANALADYEQLVYRHGVDAAEAIAAQNNLAYNAGIDANEAMWERQMYEREWAAKEEERRREWEQELWNRAYKMANAGLSNQQIADTLGVSLSDLYRVMNG